MKMMRVKYENIEPSLYLESKNWHQAAHAYICEFAGDRGHHDGVTGWFNWPERDGNRELIEIEKLSRAVTVPFDTVVVVGIGGSFAGAKAVSDCFSSSYPNGEGRTVQSHKKELFYAGYNISEEEILELLEALNERQPLLNVISKSGETLETAVVFRVLRKYLEERFGVEEARKRIIAVTDKDSGSLKALADREGYLKMAIPKNVGGRFSVLSCVGMLPLSLAGYQTSEMMNGAGSFFQELIDQSAGYSKEGPSDLHPAVEHACLRRAAWEQGYRIDILSYGHPKLRSFLEWWKQLFGESEGKEEKGLFPSGLLYSTDLHSLGQYLQEGWPKVFQTFLFIDRGLPPICDGALEKRVRVPRFLNSTDGLHDAEARYLSDINRAAMKAASQAHSGRGVPCLELWIPQIDEYWLGYLFAYFQSVCALSAKLLDVNPFDQPGVEVYKRHLKDLLELQH